MVWNIKWRLFGICVFFIATKVDKVVSSQDLMNKLTVGFSKVLEQCKSELGVGDHIMQEFYNFWREEYDLVNRDMGCVLLCMAAKHELIDEGDMTMHHGNAHEFAKSHGADDALAKQLVTILHDCETANLGISDFCYRVLEIAKCFRTKIHELKWTPSVELIMEEIMTSV